MSHSFFVLAAGLPGVIFFGAFVLLWVVSAVFGNAKKASTIVPISPRRGPGVGVPAPMQSDWRARVQQAAQAMRAQAKAKVPPMPAKRGKAQPATVTQAAQLARQAAVQAQPFVKTPAAPPAAIARSTTKAATSETVRNLRLLLQHGGVREAVLLAEILGPPMSMRE